MGEGSEIYFPRVFDVFPTELQDTFSQFIGVKPEKRKVIDFSILDIRVGRIMRVAKNPASVRALKKSYICHVEVGWERAPRIIVSELAEYYTREQLKLSKVVVLCNIPPEESFGKRSWGWILAAETPDRDIELLRPPNASVDSDQVTVWGYPPVDDLREQPDLTLKELKTLFKDLRISADGEAQYQGQPMCVEGGFTPITAGRYARDTPIINAVKNRSWKKYRTISPVELRKQIRQYIP